MHDFNLTAPKGANKKKRILGRGQGSGRGTTAGKGNKGQQARSGGKTYVGFEGGQMPLYRRIARRGFSNYPFKKEYQVINLSKIDKRFENGETVEPATLIQKGLAKGAVSIKILGNGELNKKLTIKGCVISASAKEKVEKTGGTVELVMVQIAAAEKKAKAQKRIEAKKRIEAPAKAVKTDKSAEVKQSEKGQEK